MTRYVEVATQAELDALGPDDIAVVRSGRFIAWGSSHVDARDSSHVDARDSSHVVARDSSHVVAWGSSHVDARDSSHVVAWDSSHVVARDSSHVDARGSSHVDARGSSHVIASRFVATHRHSRAATVTGGVIIDVQIDTPQDWCDFHGVEVTDGKAVLFKAVLADWKGHYKKARLIYKPGRTVKAPDWEPHARCGNGLHLSPRPRMARDYCEAVHYLAVEVEVADIVVIDDKVKVPSCRVLHEVDIDGAPIGVES